VRQTIRRLAITTGDTNGVGLEVTLKALDELTRKRALQGCQLIVFSDSVRSKRLIKETKVRIPKPLWIDLDPNASSSVQHLRRFISDERLVFVSLSRTNEAGWFDFVVRNYSALNLDGVVTGPVSKQTFIAHDPRVMGHTGLLRLAFPKKPVFQGYRGQQFNIVLATDHVPLNQVQTELTPSTIKAALHPAAQLRNTIENKRIRARPIGVLGLNPHASEGGLIGDYDERVLRPILSQLNRLGVEGPISADSAFTETNRERFSVYLCLYHDQGLIPFKTVHGMSDGFQVSLGVPLLRTSVDHGTAPGLVGLNQADAGSMKAAILGAIKIAKGSK